MVRELPTYSLTRAVGEMSSSSSTVVEDIQACWRFAPVYIVHNRTPLDPRPTCALA